MIGDQISFSLNHAEHAEFLFSKGSPTASWQIFFRQWA